MSERVIVEVEFLDADTYKNAGWRMAVPTGWIYVLREDSTPAVYVPDPDAPHVQALAAERAEARRAQDLAEDAAAQAEDFEAARAQFDAGLDADQCVSAGVRWGVLRRSVGGWSAQLLRGGVMTCLTPASSGPEARERCTAVIRAWVLEGRAPDGTERPARLETETDIRSKVQKGYRVTHDGRYGFVQVATHGAFEAHIGGRQIVLCSTRERAVDLVCAWLLTGAVDVAEPKP